MSCLNVNVQDATNAHLYASVNRVGEGMIASVFNPVAPIVAEVSDAGTHLDMITSKATRDVKVNLYDAAIHLNVKCSVVCSLAEIDDGTEAFMVMEGVFLVEDGQTFRVIKDNGYRLPE